MPGIEKEVSKEFNKSWKELFEGVDKTDKKFDELVEKFVNFVGEYYDFSNERIQMLEEYVKNFDSVSDHWDEINEYAAEYSELLKATATSVRDLQGLLQSVVSISQKDSSIINERLRIFRGMRDLSVEMEYATKREGGLTEADIRRQIRKADTLKQQLDYQTKLAIKERVKGFDTGVELTDKFGNFNADVFPDFRKASLIAQENLVSLESQLAGVIKKVKQYKQAYDAAIDPAERARYRVRLNAEREIQASLEKRIEKESQEVGLLNEELTKAGALQKIFATEQKKFYREEQNSTAGVFSALSSRVFRAMGLTGFSDAITETFNDLATERVQAKTNKAVAARKVGITRRELTVREQELKNVVSEKSYKSAQSLGDKLKYVAEQIDELHKKQDKVEELKKQLEGLEKGSSEYNKVKAQLGRAKSSEKKAAGVDRERESELTALNTLLTKAVEAEEDEVKANEALAALQGKRISLQEILNKALDGTLTKSAIAVALATATWRQLLKFDDQAVQTKRVIGQWADATALSNNNLVSGIEVLKTMTALGEQFSINPVQVFSSEELGRIAQAQKLTGMSAEAAGNLAVQSKISGKNADTYRDAIAKGASAANAQNHAAVNLSAVQNEVLTTSRAIALSYGNSTQRLAQAASTAKSLGMNLQDVENISKSLMNFESSIQSEMQAQLLTGMQLNLAKARELALNNDLEGVANEIKRQGMDAAKFSHMNYIQQDNIAKALGMSREQMSKMLIMQEINRGLSAEQVAAMTNMRKEDIEALSAQEKWQTMKQRFLESLVPLLEPVLQVVTEILNGITWCVGWISKGAAWLSRLGGHIDEDNKLARSLTGAIVLGIGLVLTKTSLLKKAFVGVFRVVGKIGKGIIGWATNLNKTAPVFKESLGRWVDPKTGVIVKTPKLAKSGKVFKDKAKQLVEDRAKTPEGGVSGLSKSVTGLGKDMGNLVKGAAAAALLAGAVFLISLACKEFASVPWSAVGKAGAALGGLVVAVTLLGLGMNFAGELILAGALAMLVVAGAVGVLGLALQQFKDLNFTKMFEGFPGAMLRLALGATAAAAAAIPLTIGSGALLVASVPLKKALQNLAYTSGAALSETATGITAIAEAVGKLGKVLGNTNLLKLGALALGLRQLKGSQIFVEAKAKPEVEVPEERLREPQEIKKENIEASAQELVIKQAQVQASAQQILIEQKETNIQGIENKINTLIEVVKYSKPGWDWLVFGQEMGKNVPWLKKA